jgi:hypothetical protein
VVREAFKSFIAAVLAFWVDAGELKRAKTEGALADSDLWNIRKGLPTQRAAISNRLDALADLMSRQVSESS